MINFDEFKDAVVNTAGNIADKSAQLAKTLADKTVVLGKITKLKTEITMEKDSIRKTFTELGKKYYETHRDAPEPEMVQACGDVTGSLAVIKLKRQEIETLKKELDDVVDDFMDDSDIPFDDEPVDAEPVPEEPTPEE